MVTAYGTLMGYMNFAILDQHPSKCAKRYKWRVQQLIGRIGRTIGTTY